MIFLGGTCNGSQWREILKPLLGCEYFDPVVDDWNEEAQQREIHARNTADYVLYVITPKMTGVYSIAEVVDDSNKRPEKTLFCVLKEDDGEVFSVSQLKSLEATAQLVMGNGAYYFKSLNAVAGWVN